jgi:glutaredoxin
MKSLTVFYRPSCAFSVGVVTFLFLRGADVRLVNLDLHSDEERRLDDAIGDSKLETPLLELDGGERHIAPTMSELKDLLVSWGLSDQVAPHTRLKEAEES